MSTAQKLITAASGVGGEGLYVEELFSTTIYTGTGSSRSITNNLDLSGEGGFVWFKSRSATRNHSIYDTARGTGKRLLPNNQGSGSAETTDNNGLSAFLSNGFTVVSADDCNKGSDSYVSWAWRKAEKFCDIVTYTGNESISNRYISHNLGVAPGMMIIKDRSANGVWYVYHRSIGATKHLRLSSDSAASTDSGTFANNAPTDAAFGVGTDSSTNGTGNNYVCWLFAHNNNDGGFGADADQDIIKCNSYAGNGSASNQIDLGFEPQWIMIKNITSSSGTWLIFDYVRGVASGGGDDFYLVPSSNAVEGQFEGIEINGNGFKITSNNASTNNSGNTYVYMAIRRSMKVPEVGTTVFTPTDNRSGTRPSVATVTTAGFMPDLYIAKNLAGVYHVFFDKVRGIGKRLRSDGANTEATDATSWVRSFDPTGVTLGGDTGAAIVNYSSNSYGDLFFRRATGFFDIQAYTGTGATPTSVYHSLGVTPELIIVKSTSNSESWAVFNSTIGKTKQGFLNTTATFGTEDTADQAGGVWGDHTSSIIQVGTNGRVGQSGLRYVAYLFATANGVSKVGTYTGNGSNQTIDCGFSNGARFVMTKRYSSTGHWNVFDSARAFDNRMELDTAASEANAAWLGTDNSGFIAKHVGNNDEDSNVSGATYLFLAIA